MIISASRRSDIPAFYGEWFLNRLRAGEFLLPHPRGRKSARRLHFSADDVEGIVFWTKNPAPFMPRLGELRDHHYYFQFTLTPYGRDLEPGLPPKPELLATMLKLSDILGPGRVVWRYDPIVLSGAYPLEFHFAEFERLAKILAGRVAECVMSFLDFYPKLTSRLRPCNIREWTPELQARTARIFGDIGRARGLALKACAEAGDFSVFGIDKAACVRAFAEAPRRRDAGQRPLCNCVESVDVGLYNCCPHACRYCYANAGEASARGNFGRHDPAAPLLYGDVRDFEIIEFRPAEPSAGLFDGLKDG